LNQKSKGSARVAKCRQNKQQLQKLVRDLEVMVLIPHEDDASHKDDNIEHKFVLHLSLLQNEPPTVKELRDLVQKELSSTEFCPESADEIEDLLNRIKLIKGIFQIFDHLHPFLEIYLSSLDIFDIASSRPYGCQAW
jgi:hypothetical protein